MHFTQHELDRGAAQEVAEEYGPQAVDRLTADLERAARRIRAYEQQKTKGGERRDD